MSFMIYDNDDNIVFDTDDPELSIRFVEKMLKQHTSEGALGCRQETTTRQDSDSDEMTEGFIPHKKAI